jgi:hypothetical protein
VITNGGQTGPKEDYVVRCLSALWAKRSELADIVDSTNSWEALIKGMRKVEGFGGTGFMSKEVVLDVILTNSQSSFWAGGPTDWQTWSPVGPGARRGVNRVLGKEACAAIREGEALSVVRSLYALREHHWPGGFVALDLSDIQFQLCEFDKYERVRLGEGRAKSRYKPAPF